MQTNLIDDWVSSLPEVYFRLKAALDNPETSFDDLGKIISSDSALVARLLKIVNSSFYNLSQPVENITTALSFVGTEQLSHLVLAASVTDQFQGIPRDLVDMKKFWKHSLACGFAAKYLSSRRGGDGLESMFLAGMLHDVGKLVLFKKLPDVSRKVLEISRDKKMPANLIEKEIIGYDHALVGQELLRAWKLPESLVDPVAHHHDPFESEDYQFKTATVSLANIIANTLGHTCGNRSFDVDPQADPVGIVGLNKDELEQVSEEINYRLDELVEFFF